MNVSNRAVLVTLAASISSALSCSLGGSLPPTIAPDCESADGPSQSELEFVLDFPQGLFDSAAWRRSFTVESTRISATWTSRLGSVAYIDYLAFPCGYTQSDLDDYFSEANFKSIFFADYDELAPVASCSTESADLILHEFTAQWQEDAYDIRFWIMKFGEARVINAVLAVPASDREELDGLSLSLFPALPKCSVAATSGGPTTRWSRPGQPGVWFRRDTSLGLAGRLISRPLGGQDA